MISFARMPPVRWRCLAELLQIQRTSAVLQAAKGGSNVPKELPSNVATLLISDKGTFRTAVCAGANAGNQTQVLQGELAAASGAQPLTPSESAHENTASPNGRW